MTTMDTGKMLTPSSAARIKKVATPHSLFFKSDLVCSDSTLNAYVWLEIDLGIILKNPLIISFFSKDTAINHGDGGDGSSEQI